MSITPIRACTVFNVRRYIIDSPNLDLVLV